MSLANDANFIRDAGPQQVTRKLTPDGVGRALAHTAWGEPFRERGDKGR